MTASPQASMKARPRRSIRRASGGRPSVPPARPAASRGAELLRAYGSAALVPALALGFIAAGAVLARAADGKDAARAWALGLVLTGAPVVWRTAGGMLRGRFAADVVAMLAVVTAVALRQPLAGLVIVLMQTGGEALERYARGRASEAVRELEAAAPRVAHRIVGDAIEDVDADGVEAGDLLLVRPGELVPCDGVVEAGSSHLDASRLTGEPVPVRASPGTPVMSGSANQEGALRIRASAPAREGRYARIVELVRAAQESRAPIQRLADRYAVWFTPVTLAVCALAWGASGDPLRALAVLVVATPCPLILATPVAIIGGINRAARRQVVVRQGGALEQLAQVRVAVLDKTGTLTIGLPQVAGVTAAPGVEADEALRLAAAVEQGSGHLLARTLVAAARERGMALPPADHVVEAAGRGVRGRVEGRAVAVGSLRYVAEVAPDSAGELRTLDAPSGGLRAFVAVDGRAAARVDYADRIREGVGRLFGELRALGVGRLVMVSGDHADRAGEVATALGVDEAHAELLPEQKVDVVRRLVDGGAKVVMLGDGTNDAPALAAATVGVALAGHGGGISAEAADVVILADDPARLADAVRIGRRTLRIARQSIRAGLGLSAAAMCFAAAGLIAPTAGALLQELIDVAVILNALRASR